MSIINLLLKSGSSLAKQGIARVLPTGEDRVLRGLRAYGERAIGSSSAPERGMIPGVFNTGTSPVDNRVLRESIGGMGTTVPFGAERSVARGLGIGQAAGSATGAVAGGGATAQQLGQDGEISGQDVLGILGGAALGGLAGRSVGGGLGAASQGAGLRGVIAKPQLRQMRELGVKESAEGGIEQAGMVAKNRARAIGVPENMLSNIKDGEREVTAFRKAYEAAYKHIGGAFGAPTKKELPALQQYVRTAPKPVPAPPTGIPLTQKLSTTFSSNAPKVVTKDFDNVNKVTKVSQVSSGVDDVLSPVRHAANPQDLARLARDGEVNKLAQAVEDIQNNFLRLVTEQDIADIAARNGTPVFYVLHNLATRARAAALDMPLTKLLGAQGPASSQATPILEVQRAMAALKLPTIDRLEKSGAVTFASRDISTPAAKAIKNAQIEQGALVNTGDMIRSPLQTVEEIQDDIIRFFKDPLSVTNIREKIWTYLGTIGSPMQKVVSTMDSWMMRAGFGNMETKTAANSLEYRLMHEALNDLASRLGVPPAALQEAIWKNVRVLRGETGKAFSELFTDKIMYPNLGTTAKVKPASLPSIVDVMKTPEMRKSNKVFVSKLIKAMKDDPSIADYVQIVGEDVEFTDEFFKTINLF